MSISFGKQYSKHLAVQKVQSNSGRTQRLDYKSLRNKDIAEGFIQEVRHNFPHNLCRDLHSNVSETCQKMVTCLSEAAAVALPTAVHTAKYPWISMHTVSLIDQRHAARVSKDHVLERYLHKEVKQSAKQDRTKWLDDLASSGDWNSL